MLMPKPYPQWFWFNLSLVWFAGEYFLNSSSQLWNLESFLKPQLCPTLCNPMDCSSPGSFVHEILQARILEWVSFPSPEDLPNPGQESQPRDQTQVFCIAGRFFTIWATREAPTPPVNWINSLSHGFLICTVGITMLCTGRVAQFTGPPQNEHAGLCSNSILNFRMVIAEVQWEPEPFRACMI